MDADIMNLSQRNGGADIAGNRSLQRKLNLLTKEIINKVNNPGGRSKPPTFLHNIEGAHMIGCLISLIVVAIVTVIIIYIVETALAAIFPPPPQIYALIRLLAGLLILLWFLECVGIFPGHIGPIRY